MSFDDIQRATNRLDKATAVSALAGPVVIGGLVGNWLTTGMAVAPVLQTVGFLGALVLGTAKAVAYAARKTKRKEEESFINQYGADIEKESLALVPKRTNKEIWTNRLSFVVMAGASSALVAVSDSVSKGTLVGACFAAGLGWAGVTRRDITKQEVADEVRSNLVKSIAYRRVFLAKEAEVAPAPARRFKR